MTDEREPLPVHGYTSQPQAKVDLVNGFKQDEERLLRKIDAMTPPTGTLAARYAVENGISPKFDQRWLAIARSHFEQGFMALNRAVFQPQRISLPEDETK